MNDWADWIGRNEVRAGHIDPECAARWLATLDRDAPVGGTMPHAYHWCLGLPDTPTAALGTDGHPLRSESPDSFLPPVPLPRRMWASSKVEFFAPLIVGEAFSRQSKILSITNKNGGSGHLVFVEVEQETSGKSGLAVREVQTIVYKEAAVGPATGPATGPTATSAPASEGGFDPGQWRAHQMVVPNPALLFRYSALTFNAHRIHYDLPYAMNEEGYRGLVVHGPLTATLLLGLAQREFGDNSLENFAFRGLSPAIGGEDLHLVLNEEGGAVNLGAFANDGHQIMRATATLSAKP